MQELVSGSAQLLVHYFVWAYVTLLGGGLLLLVALAIAAILDQEEQ